MQIQVLKSKIHRVKVTGADLNYIGSITIDETLLETYAIKGERNSGEITLNGPAARKVQKDDIIIIIAYATLEFEEAKTFKPWIIFPNEKDNSLT